SFETRDTLTSLMMGTGNVVAGLLLGVVSYWALLWLWQFRFFNLGLSIWVFVAAFLLDDLRLLRLSPRRASGALGLGRARQPSFQPALQSLYGVAAKLDRPLYFYLHPAGAAGAARLPSGRDCLRLRLQPRLAVLDPHRDD